MTRALLQDLSVLFALESCDEPDEDEAMRLSAIANELRERAEALKPRGLPHMTTTQRAS